MADFNEWVQPPKRRYKRIFEGDNYQNIYTDAGNWTGGAVGVGDQIGSNMSISAPVLSEYLGRTATLSDMQNLSIQTALAITKDVSWDKINADSIKSQVIAEFTADNKSSAGYNGSKQTQKALNSLGYQVPTNGRIESQTLQALNQAHDKGQDFKLYHLIRDNMKSYYISLNRPEFINGWLNGLDRDYPERAATDPIFKSSKSVAGFSFSNIASGKNLAPDLILTGLIIFLISLYKRRK